MKLSQSLSKATLPGRKGVTRFLDSGGRFFADAIHLAGEEPPGRMQHPHESSKQLELAGCGESEPLLREVMTGGELVAPLPSVPDAAAHAKGRLEKLPPEHQRLENPHTFKVGLSPALTELRDALCRQINQKQNQ
jgi:nicotinate phosphoribosyltransferase